MPPVRITSCSEALSSQDALARLDALVDERR
jgi:hypothetical protein